MVASPRLWGALCLVAVFWADASFAGPAIDPGSSPPGAPGDNSGNRSGGFGINFSGDVVFSPLFSSSVERLFSAPDDFRGVGSTGPLPYGLLNTDTTLMSALVRPAYADPMIAPMAPILETLPNPLHRHPSYAEATQLGIPSYYCLTQAQQNAKQYRYWSFTHLSEPGAGPLGRISDSGVPDREAVENPTDTNEEWCSANLPKHWAVEPFRMNVWVPVIVLSLGFLVFWSVRGFKKP